MKQRGDQTTARRHDGYEVKPYPRIRHLIIDVGHVASHKYYMRGLYEVDVTEPRRLIREHKDRTGEKLSFTAFVIACLGRAVDVNRHMHACRSFWDRLIIFDEVDVTMTIATEIDGHLFPLVHTLRAANRRTFRELHDELRQVQDRPARSPGMDLVEKFALLPPFARRFAFWLIGKSPRLQKRLVGTVGMTAVGMFASGGGWGFSLPSHTLAVALGGIAEKPGVLDGRIEIREYLSVTLAFDHAIVDGVPAARFATRFKELLESGYGLRDEVGASSDG